MKLGLFFTRGISLQTWVETGLFEREKRIYEAHLDQGNLSGVIWFTYGANDKCISDQLKKEVRLHKKIEVVPMPFFFRGKMGILIYSLLLPIIRRSVLGQVDILKTNQMDGSWSAVFAKWMKGKPLIVRTGYTWSIFKSAQKVSRIKKWIVKILEYFAFKNASISTVTTQSQKDYITENYSLPSKSIKVVPNYIDAQLFIPIKNSAIYQNHLIFVGRLNEQKNLLNLINAIAESKFTLDIYGDGDMKGELEKHSKDCNARINFMGSVPNSRLPEILSHYQFYILPSYFEGMPKTLLEAMACGLVCIGTNVPGINDIIDDGINGYLAQGTDADSIVNAIGRAVSGNREMIAKNSREYILKKFSLEQVANKELSIFKEIF